MSGTGNIYRRLFPGPTAREFAKYWPEQFAEWLDDIDHAEVGRLAGRYEELGAYISGLVYANMDRHEDWLRREYERMQADERDERRHDQRRDDRLTGD